MEFGLILVLGVFVLVSYPGNSSMAEIDVRDVNITVGGNWSAYPDTVLVLPADFPSASRSLLLDQRGADTESVQTQDVEDNAELERVIQAAILHYSLPMTTNSSAAPPQIYSLSNPEHGDDNYIRRRRRRSLRKPTSSLRVKRHWMQGCGVCQSPPQKPLVIKIIKVDDCGGGCFQPCGPQCRPQKPVYHPQSCNPCKPPPPPPPPPAPSCDSCGHQFSGGSYSMSSASASASSHSSSFSWGGRK